MSREDLTISTISFNKITKNITNAGFREGVSAGKDKSFQTGFDIGYAEGFQTGEELGYMKGLVFAQQVQKEVHPVSDTGQHVADLMLNKAHSGLCQLCKEDATVQDNPDDGTDAVTITLAGTIERQQAENEKSLRIIKVAYADKLNNFGVR